MKNKGPILGIDASRSSRGNPTGVERYSTEIIKAILNENPDFRVRLYSPKKLKQFPKEKQWVIWFPRLWSLVRLSLEMLFRKPKILFIPAHVLPFFAPKRSYVTIHDVAFEKYPVAYGTFQSFYLGWSTRRAVNKAHKVIVPTEAVKKDLMKYYGADASKIMVVHHGRLPVLKIAKEDVNKILQHFGLDPTEPLFFFIGRLETKKNLMMLLNAWEIVQKKYLKGRLFLGGMYGHGWNELFHRIEDKDMAGTVIAPGYISEVYAAGLFRAATALILPSREEGFGMPVLQAFEADCAVICSDIPALREVGGDGALYADPGIAKDFAKQMMRLIDDPSLEAKLVAKGLKRLEDFSWEKAATRLVEEFEKSD